jgi:hypothetical protein
MCVKINNNNNNYYYYDHLDRLCSLVVTVPSYTARGPEFDSLRYQIS